MMSSQNTNRGSARTHGELTVCDNWAAQNICLHNKCKVHSTSVFFLFYISSFVFFFRCTKIQHATWKKFSTRMQTFGLLLMWRRDSILQCKITWQYMCVTSHMSKFNALPCLAKLVPKQVGSKAKEGFLHQENPAVLLFVNVKRPLR